MKNQNRKIIYIMCFLFVFLVLVGTSYASWQIYIEQESNNIVESNCFEINFEEKGNIQLTNASPMKEEELENVQPYQFKIRNTCKTATSYQINLEVLDSSTLANLEYIKVMLNDNLEYLKLKEETKPTVTNAVTSYKLETGYIDELEEKEFDFKMWISEEAPPKEELMGKILESKITIITNYIEHYDKTPPIANVNVSKNGNDLVIDASNSKDEYSGIKKYYYSYDNINWIESEEAILRVKDEGITYGIGVNAIKSSKDFEVYAKVEDGFGNQSEVKKGVYVRNASLVYDGTVDNNLRYIGSNPNNYVLFNNELWRVIGVMNNINDGTGKKESRLKIIRNANYKKAAWSTNNRNNWNNASMKNELNGSYYNSLSVEARSLIENAVWNLGGVTSGYTSGIITSSFYKSERSTSVYSGNPVSWTGQIGLIYPSDYGYSTAGGSSKNRETCLKTAIYNWENANVDCKNGSWIHKGAMWTITHLYFTNGHSDGKKTVVGILIPGNTSNPEAKTATYQIFPTAYLKSDVKIISGTGSSSNPFKISI